jgi:hypothetical protein
VHVACFGGGAAEAAGYLRAYAGERPVTEVDHNVYGDSIIRIYMGPYEQGRAWELADAISAKTFAAAVERPGDDRPCDATLHPGRPPRTAKRP